MNRYEEYTPEEVEGLVREYDRLAEENSHLKGVEHAAIELDKIFCSYVGETDDWPLKIEYSDEGVADSLIEALNNLHRAVSSK